ncbi:heat shock 70 kDa protein 12A-like [Mya arenaria]|uniref:heat shock 70 kDa protein 12A-like n=1 Tax=Mya arenaria TaxID=6604 RepID=UPI0022E16F6E|nr:heat shock 70 kDa protein 12A-like [Mya arenaria]
MATTKVDDSLRTLLNDDISIAKKTDHLLVAAIDFGTTFTGYAFSTKNILDDRINCSSFQAEGFKSEKAPTCQLSRKMKIKDLKGKELLAIDVFSKVIKHLSEELNEQLRKQVTGIDPDDVLWVITIPAIWSDAAKQFMREAANKV